MQWWWECSHFKDALGRLVLDRLYGPESTPGFGLELSPDNIEAHIESIRTGRNAWRERCLGETELVPKANQELGLDHNEPQYASQVIHITQIWFDTKS